MLIDSNYYCISVVRENLVQTFCWTHFVVVTE